MGNVAKGLEEEKISHTEDHWREPVTFREGIEAGKVWVVNGEVRAEVYAAEKWG